MENKEQSSKEIGLRIYLDFLANLFKAMKRGHSFKGAFYSVAKRYLDRDKYPLAYHLAIEALKRYGFVRLISKEIMPFVKEESKAEAISSLVILMEREEMIERVNEILREHEVPYDVRRLRDFIRKSMSELGLLERFSIEYSLPLWLVKRIIELMGMNDGIKLMRAFLKRDVAWLRVNTLKISIEEAIKCLEDMGIYVEEDKEFPIILKVPAKYLKDIATSNLVKEFKLFIQDKASIAAVYALDPRPGDIILDMCAAPGMKTSAIVQLIEDRGKVIAVDISRRRIQRLRYIMKKIGARNVEILVADSTRMEFSVHFDKVLVDAPCTSSGALQIDPSLRIRLERGNLIERVVRIQTKLLRKALQLGDIIVYCTCSILPEEGEEIVDHVLDKGLARAFKVCIPGVEGYKGYRCSEDVRRYFPHIHHTQGFFIACLKSTIVG
ncbi:MAG: hypothetical protein DRJ66_02810 [Thermoprotei archaeon]|nr:MAG: hypothetical protein DRJ66_02810 [Thermoprotei archaeon]RLF20653.1 MAG: hypothetical protein DRZ82_01370 [Thermoprotei archaeon]